MLIDFDRMMRKHDVRAKGVLHLGASEGQEAPAYHKHKLKMAFVEALPNVYDILKNNVKDMDAVCYNACVSNVEGSEVVFNVADNGGQSSSMLEFGTHLKDHPTVNFVDKITMKTRRADTLVENIGDYDMLVMDLQGAELLALQGLGDKLYDFNYVYTEVNTKEVYKGCPQLKDMDMFLRMYGFDRVETKMTNWGWGDAFYKKKRTNSNHVNHRRPNISFSTSVSMPVVYPSNNNNDFEKYFRQKYKGEGSREYIPVMWTAYQLRFGNNRAGTLWLQQYLNGLDKSKKYFTVVQHDDGIQYDLRGLDVKVFAMSGNRIDYPLPLIAEPYTYRFNEQRNIFASFIGARTHRIRNMLKKSNDFVVKFSHDTPENYCKLMAQSVFALCPRGYGPTSFRIAEALQYGAIPVYISDRFIEPHNVPFETYGIKVEEKDTDNLYRILKGINKERIKQLQEAGKQAYKDLFTYDATYNKIIENL